MRDKKVIELATVCQNAHSFQDPNAQTIDDFRLAGLQDCPLMDPCFTGQLEARRICCGAVLGSQMAREVALEGSTIEREVADLSGAPIFYPRTAGFIDPYNNPDAVITDKAESIELVKKWAGLVMGVEIPVSETKQPSREEIADDLEKVGFARLVDDDQYETVFPDGVAKRVKRDQCRCPVIKVGDFCPVHGG